MSKQIKARFQQDAGAVFWVSQYRISENELCSPHEAFPWDSVNMIPMQREVLQQKNWAEG